MAESLLDAITGGLLGVAAGDALGATVEFMTPEEIEEKYGVHREIIGGSDFKWRPGEGTDDTDLTAVSHRVVGFEVAAGVHH